MYSLVKWLLPTGLAVLLLGLYFLYETKDSMSTSPVVRIGIGHPNQEYFDWGCQVNDELNSSPDLKNYRDRGLHFEIVLTSGPLETLCRMQENELELGIVPEPVFKKFKPSFYSRLELCIFLYTEKTFLVYRRGELSQKEELNRFFKKRRIAIDQSSAGWIPGTLNQGRASNHPEVWARWIFEELKASLELTCPFSTVNHTLSELPNDPDLLAQYIVDGMICRYSQEKALAKKLKRPQIRMMKIKQGSQISMMKASLDLNEEPDKEIVCLAHTTDVEPENKDFQFFKAGIFGSQADIRDIEKKLKDTSFKNNFFISYKKTGKGPGQGLELAVNQLKKLKISLLFLKKDEINADIMDLIEASQIPELKFIALDQRLDRKVNLYVNKKVQKKFPEIRQVIEKFLDKVKTGSGK